MLPTGWLGGWASGVPILTPRERLGGRVAGRYRLDRVIAVGGMGVLFAGYDEATGADVAVKLLKPRYDGELDKDARLLREARIGASLQHPNVVRVLDFGPACEDDGSFIAMELLSGLSLEDELRARGQLTAEETLALIAPVLGAVAAAHDRGIVHRDLKPANIFLAHDAGGRVVPKVLDFGVAKNLAKAYSMFALANLYLVRRRLMPPGATCAL